MRLCDRITASWNFDFVTWPLRSICMSQTKHRRSTSDFSEQMPLDRVSGSIGTTKPGKYTDVARFCASSSSGVSGRPQCETSAIATTRRKPPRLGLQATSDDNQSELQSL